MGPGSSIAWPPPRQRDHVGNHLSVKSGSVRSASLGQSETQWNHDKIKRMNVIRERGRAARSAADRIAETMRSVPFKLYQSSETGVLKSDAQLVEEIQGPVSTREIAYYDKCTDFEASETGRMTVTSTSKDTVWLEPCSRRESRGVDKIVKFDTVEPAAQPNAGRLHGRIKQCTASKQSLQGRLLAQVTCKCRRRIPPHTTTLMTHC